MTNKIVVPVNMPKKRLINKPLHIKRSYGMTLIELMIVIVIIGILSSMAVSSYSKYSLQARRDDGKNMLLSNASKLQRCLTLIGSYNGVAPMDCKLITTSAEGHYTLTSTLGQQTWELSAAAVANGRQVSDTDCKSFVLNHIGQKSATGDKPETCW